MKRVASIALLAGLLAVCARAGTVTFDPPVVTVAAGETAEYLVTITSTDLVDFDAISLLFSSYTEGLDVSFVHDPSLVTSLDPPEPAPALAFPTDLFAGGNNFGLWQAPAVVGTLRIDTTGLAPGTYDDIIALRPDEEAAIFSEPISAVALGSTGESEALSGTAGLVVTGSDTGGDDGGSTETPTDEPADTTDTDVDGDEPNTPTDDPDVPAGTGDDDGADPIDPQDTTGDDGDDTGDAGDTIGTDDDSLPDADEGVGDGEVITGDAAADEDDPSVGPRVGGGFCGLGMLGSCLFILLGLATLKSRRSVRLS